MGNNNRLLLPDAQVQGNHLLDLIGTASQLLMAALIIMKHLPGPCHLI